MNQVFNINFWQENEKNSIVSIRCLTLENSSTKNIKCQLECEVDIIQYQAFEQNNSFNLSPEIRGPISGKIKDGPPINLQLLLKPEFSPLLLKHAQTTEEAIDYLAQLNRQQTTLSELPNTISPLLQTESWLCLSVKQQQGDHEVGFNTFWHSVNPALINDPNTTSDQLAEGIVNFVKEWTEVNLTEATQNATTHFLQNITETFGDLMYGALAEEEDSEEDEQDDLLFEKVTTFFENEEWPFVELSDKTSLRLSFRGDNGQWNCFAKVNPEQQTFLFYSICPITTPKNRRGNAAEFITRANYGMVIGNFEMDYSDGEIRYKTSIDVERSLLSQALIRQLVYANVLMMNQYLPGLLAVIEDGMNAEAAITLVEA